MVTQDFLPSKVADFAFLVALSDLSCRQQNEEKRRKWLSL